MSESSTSKHLTSTVCLVLSEWKSLKGSVSWKKPIATKEKQKQLYSKKNKTKYKKTIMKKEEENGDDDDDISEEEDDADD